nr:hypothetical protein BDOA9_0201910 [Bradyrhizobium sp. DOA9]
MPTSLRGLRVVRELEIGSRRGGPVMCVSDNGTDFTGVAVLRCCQEIRIEWHYIAPGKPTQNRFIESFMYRRPRGCKGISAVLWMPLGCIHVYGLFLRPMPWPLALMEIADRGLINGSRLLRLKLFGLARSPAPPVSNMLSFALTP